MTAKAIYFVDVDGSISRIRLPYGGEKAALKTVEVISPEAQSVELSYKKSGYHYLEETIVLVGHFYCPAAAATLGWWADRLEASISGFLWTVRGECPYHPTKILGLYGSFQAAKKAADAWVALAKPNTRAARIELVKIND